MYIFNVFSSCTLKPAKQLLTIITLSTKFNNFKLFHHFQVWQMVPRKLQVSETFHSISKSWNGICDESQSLVFVSFLESRIFELFAVKSPIFKQGLRISASLGFYHSPPLLPHVEKRPPPTPPPVYM